MSTEDRRFLERGLQKLRDLYPRLETGFLEEASIDVIKKAMEVILEVFELSMAWVGLVEEGRFSVKPVASVGFEADYIKSIKVTWDDSEFSRGPTGQAIKTLRPKVQSNIDTDPTYLPWREESLKRGYRSSAAFPILSVNGKCLGALNLYSPQPAFFDAETVQDIQTLLNQGIITARACELHESEERFRSIAERSFDAIYTTDLEGRTTYVSPSTERIIGYSPKEMIEKHFTDFIPESEIPRTVEAFARTLKGEFVKGYELKVRRKDGYIITVVVNSANVIKDGEVVGYQGIFRDISEQVQAEKRIRELAYRLNNVEPGECYLSESHERCLKAYADLSMHKVPGLCITREDPQKLVENYGIKAEDVMLLSSRPLKGFPALTDLQEVSRAISSVLEEGGGVVLLDGLEYVITRFGFDPVYTFIQEKRFDFLEADAVLLIPLDPATLSEREYALLASELNILN